MNICARRVRGYSMINVLVALVVFSLGLLGLCSMYGKFAVAETQDQNLAHLVPLSQQFGALLNADKTLVAASVGTKFSTVANAPAGLQDWMTALLDPNVGVVSSNGKVTVAISQLAAPAVAAPCSNPAGVCAAVEMVVTWNQDANWNGNVFGQPTRSQTFDYQIGF